MSDSDDTDFNTLIRDAIININNSIIESSDHHIRIIMCPVPGNDVPYAPLIMPCQICTVNQINTVNLPCGHCCMCSTCAYRLLHASSRCPMCRVELIEITRIYICSDVVPPPVTAHITKKRKRR